MNLSPSSTELVSGSDTFFGVAEFDQKETRAPVGDPVELEDVNVAGALDAAGDVTVFPLLSTDVTR